MYPRSSSRRRREERKIVIALPLASRRLLQQAYWLRTVGSFRNTTLSSRLGAYGGFREISFPISQSTGTMFRDKAASATPSIHLARDSGSFPYAGANSPTNAGMSFCLENASILSKLLFNSVMSSGVPQVGRIFPQLSS